VANAIPVKASAPRRARRRIGQVMLIETAP
jgi:hypothetical protein